MSDENSPNFDSQIIIEWKISEIVTIRSIFPALHLLNLFRPVYLLFDLFASYSINLPTY